VPRDRREEKKRVYWSSASVEVRERDELVKKE
jgi:hypothetical protein